jgi:diacylglycerol kinase (ATP)
VKALLVINPKAGGGRSSDLLQRLETLVADRVTKDLTVSYTESTGHAAELAKEAAKAGHSLVIAAGGDGTVSECARGIYAVAEADRPVLAIVGLGTGSDFARGLGLSHRLSDYVEVIRTGNERACDLGLCTFDENVERTFLNVLSFGLGGLVDEYVASASRTLGAKATYFGASVRALVKGEPLDLRVSATREQGVTMEHRLRTFNFAVCNGSYFGSGMKIAPEAKLVDGLFDCVALGHTGKVLFALKSLSVYSGRHLQDPETAYFQAAALSVKRADGGTLTIDVDGEALRAKRADIRVAKGAIRLRA